jgi:hypothetical protein
MIRAVLAAFVLVSAFLSGPAPAAAQSVPMTWKFKAFHKNIVDIQFYSQNRRNTWPGGNKVWSVKNFETQNIRISCISGERICYGAWVRGTGSSYWGVGQSQKYSCTGCCYTCQANTSTPVINLNAR